jgi:pantoate--beta-alanine ligase
MTILISNREELMRIITNSPCERALIPTMGALHEGHLSLIKLAQTKCKQIWVSIFVNPLQFAAHEDLGKYPRTLDQDLKLLESLKVDYVFAPHKEEIYGKYPYELIKADKALSDCLCGLSRTDHFDGVCTVVKILFDLIKPDYAIFGEKDYQQLQIIREMVNRYKLNLEIIAAPIIREANGLAMSSRNQYLTDEQKNIASNIFRILQIVKQSKATCQEALGELARLGIEVEYIEAKWERIFIAAKIAGVRLIDNL